MDMVYVVLKVYYPIHKAEDLVKIFMEVQKKYPPDESIAETLIQGAGRSTEKGYEGMTIWKVKEGQFVKFTKRIISAMSMYNNIEGLVWSTDVWATAEEIAAAG
jgi:hypothetical protein